MKNQIIAAAVLLMSVFAHAQDKNVFDIARSGTLEEIQTIYKTQPELINEVNDGKATPLLLACYRGNEPVALFLTDKVKDVNYNSGRGTALMASVISGNISILKKLIANKADLNQSDVQGKTALIYATFYNKNEMVKELVSAGADKKQKDKDGKTALDYATFNKNSELKALLDK